MKTRGGGIEITRRLVVGEWRILREAETTSCQKTSKPSGRRQPNTSLGTIIYYANITFLHKIRSSIVFRKMVQYWYPVGHQPGHSAMEKRTSQQIWSYKEDMKLFFMLSFCETSCWIKELEETKRQWRCESGTFGGFWWDRGWFEECGRHPPVFDGARMSKVLIFRVIRK